MKNDKSALLVTWSLAILAVVAGILLSLHALGNLGRTIELWQKKSGDLQRLGTLKQQVDRHKTIVADYNTYPAKPAPFESIAHSALPGKSMTTVNTEASPAIPGWTTRKISVEFNDIGGDELGKLLDAGATASPPWALVDCTIFSASTPGRIAKASLVFETAERNQ